jgi:hypothetical protein
MNRLRKGRIQMGSPTHDKNSQVTFLKQRLNMFLDVLDAIDPEDTDLDDIDNLIKMIDELESKCKEFNNREVPESV